MAIGGDGTERHGDQIGDDESQQRQFQSYRQPL